MKRMTAASSALAAATLVSTMTLMGASGALASEPVRLNVAQMDTITAGAGVKSKFDAWSNATGKRPVVKTNTSADASPNTTSGTGSATASTSDGSVKTKVDGYSEAQVDDKTSAKVQVTTTGEAKGDAKSDSKGKTSATKGSHVAVAHGVAITKASGDDVKVTATAVPTAQGDITRTVSKNKVNEKAGLAVAVGVAVAVNLPDQARKK
jgi:hypothetical protein